MRSHRIDSPSASTAYETGRPDACSLCHLDKPLSWSEAALTEWYGQPPIETVRYTTKPPSAAVEWLLRGDAAQRALIAWHMGWAPAQEASDTDWMVPYLSLTLQDPYSAVRYIAGASLKTLPDYADIDYNHTHDKALRQKAVDWTDERWGAMNRVGPRPAVLMREDGTIDTAKMETYLLVRDNRDVSVSE